MKGDVLDFLTARRGDQLFVEKRKPQLHRDYLMFPKVSEHFIQLCGFLHLMDASLVAGRLQRDDHKVAKLSTHMPFLDDPFVHLWIAFGKTKNQGIWPTCTFFNLSA